MRISESDLTPIERQLVAAARAIAEGVLPVEARQDALDLHARVTARVETPNHGAHARAGDRIDGDVQLVEQLEHAGMGRAARAPAPHRIAAALPPGGCHRTPQYPVGYLCPSSALAAADGCWGDHISCACGR